VKRFPYFKVIILAGIIAAVFLFLERLPSPEQKEAKDKKIPGTQQQAKPARDEKHPRAAKPAPSDQGAKKQHGMVAVIIDDIGFDMKALRDLTDIPAPIAFSVLPYSPHRADAIEFLHARNKEILLHLPMEPHGYPEQSPGKGALMASMDEDQIVRQLKENLAAVPYASGVNNHMGSLFMEDTARLKKVMVELKKQGMFFIDSRTSPGTTGRTAASQTGIPFAERDIFIDHEKGYQAAKTALRSVSRHQATGDNKPLLLIGHPYKDTIRAIKDILPEWHKEGIHVVSVKKCLTNSK
jgi:polysaccharide deacetylase 2 family uncharacterized protein YibQ